MLDDNRMLEQAKAAFYSKNYEEAIPVLSRLAAGGVPEAEYLLGEAYEFGDGVAVEPERALELYQRAHSKGDGRAALALGRLADPTNRHANDAMEALRTPDAELSSEFYRAALGRFDELARHGDPDAMSLLGQCHLYGWGTQPDLGRALLLLTQAFALGCAFAGNELFSIYASPHSELYDRDKAQYYYSETRRRGCLFVRDPSYEP
jgi:TPR repeat protein